MDFDIGSHRGSEAELVFIIGYQTFASKFTKAFSLAPQGFSEEHAA